MSGSDVPNHDLFSFTGRYPNHLTSFPSLSPGILPSSQVQFALAKITPENEHGCPKPIQSVNSLPIPKTISYVTHTFPSALHLLLSSIWIGPPNTKRSPHVTVRVEFSNGMRQTLGSTVQVPTRGSWRASSWCNPGSRRGLEAVGRALTLTRRAVSVMMGLIRCIVMEMLSRSLGMLYGNDA